MAACKTPAPAASSTVTFVLIALATVALVPTRRAPAQDVDPAPPATASSPSLDPSTFAGRRKACFDLVASAYQKSDRSFSGGGAFFAAEALFESGNIAGGCSLAGRGLDGLEPNTKNRWIYGGNSGFTAWPGIDCYVRFNRFFDDALKQRFKRIYTGAVFYRRLTTSNHTIMAAVTRYLATQTWGEDAFNPDPFFTKGKAGDAKSLSVFTSTDPTGAAFVKARMASAVRGGPGEYASRPYGAQNILPFLSLAECATDPAIARAAEMSYEVCIAQLAGAYLHGHLGTFSTRSYPDMLCQQPWGVAALLWMYFGGVAPADPERQWSLRAATADYRLPDAIVAAGTDRSKPYVLRSRMNGWALYSYVNRSYVLFSRSPKAAHPKVLEQNYPCGVMWDQPDASKASQLWITNPAADAANDADPPANPTSGIHTHGVTNFEQEVQFENDLLFVFSIPATWRNPHVLGFIPGGYDAAINDAKTTGRIFLDYGSVLIAITAAAPFDWNPSAGMRAPAGKPHPGDSEFRLNATQTAVALETALPGEFPGSSPQEQLAAFRRAVLARSRLQVSLSPEAAGQYTDRAGTAIACIFDGDDSINGRKVDYKAWPVLESPWMRQLEGGDLDISGLATVRHYNFGDWTISEEGR